MILNALVNINKIKNSEVINIKQNISFIYFNESLPTSQKKVFF